MKDQLIVALDVPTLKEARRFVRLLKNQVSLYKVGLELFTVAGSDAVRMIHDEGGRVFLDLKFHDIPNTVARACLSAAKLGVFMLNVHARGGREMMSAAADAVGRDGPIILGVTVLTSDPKRRGTKGEVIRLAREARSSGLDGVVCSALEVRAVRRACGEKFVIVTPGIRPSGSARGDQKRVVTPSDAVRWGANYLVVGRPILSAPNPLQVVESITNEVSSSPN